jgi:hypothetical protein
MQRYWEQHPPVGDLVAAFLGYKGPVGAASSRPGRGDPAPTYGSPEELMATFSASGGKVKG